MSELAVFVFRDQYRAPEVLNELRRRGWEWVGDLNDAVAVTLDKKGKAKVHLSVDLSTNGANAWARMWASLLGVTLFLPLTDVMAEAVDRMAFTSGALTDGSRNAHTLLPDARWWKECLRLPDDFLRDIGAVIKPGDSAIFMLLRVNNLQIVMQQLRNYGDTLIHTSLGPEQDEQMNAMLARG